MCVCIVWWSSTHTKAYGSPPGGPVQGKRAEDQTLPCNTKSWQSNLGQNQVIRVNVKWTFPTAAMIRIWIRSQMSTIRHVSSEYDKPSDAIRLRSASEWASPHIHCYWQPCKKLIEKDNFGGKKRNSEIKVCTEFMCAELWFGQKCIWLKIIQHGW